MNIRANRGDRIIVTETSAKNGYSPDVDKVKQHLEINKVYTVERTVVHDWTTDVELQGFPNRFFNSVNFDDYETNKILIIGQAPPAVKQQFPYDTTMLYDWLSECGVSKEAAQDIFEFEALMDKFPGYDHVGGHRKPSYLEKKAHWEDTLEAKVIAADKVILLGSEAAMWLESQVKTWSCNLQVLHLMHPSKRNTFRYRQNKENIIQKLKHFIAA